MGIIEGVGRRLKRFRKSKNLTQKSVASSIGTSSGHISDLESGKKLPGSETLYSLMRNFGLNINWLLSGEGEMFLAEGAKASFDEDRTRQAVREMIDTFWAQASDEKKAWFKVELERHFPELSGDVDGTGPQK